MSVKSRFPEFESDYDESKLPSWPREYACRLTPELSASKNAGKFLLAREKAGLQLICAVGNLHSYDPARGYWLSVPDEAMEAEIRALDGRRSINIPVIETMVRDIRASQYTDAVPFTWLTPPANPPNPLDMVLCGNGWLDASTMKLHKLTPDYFATSLPKWHYDPKATCPLWMKFIGEVLDGSYHDALQEWCGYLLTPDVSLHKMAWMIGATRAGKGTILRVLRHLIGWELAATPQLEQLGDTFGLQGIVDKRHVIIGDAESASKQKRTQAVAHMKALTGGDAVDVLIKYHGPLTGVHLPVKITLGGNTPPNMLDESGALNARQLPFDFNNTVPPDKRDPDLTDKLVAQVPGIVNWALIGLARLRKNKAFTIGKDAEATLKTLEATHSIGTRFVNDCINVSGAESDRLPLDLVYDAYVDWANKAGIKPGNRRDRDQLKEDIMSRYRSDGVRYLAQRLRWSESPLVKYRSERFREWLHGVKFKKGETPQ
jgi:P4 family phage/plasmid primase-like protien